MLAVLSRATRWWEGLQRLEEEKTLLAAKKSFPLVAAFFHTHTTPRAANPCLQLRGARALGRDSTVPRESRVGAAEHFSMRANHDASRQAVLLISWAGWANWIELPQLATFTGGDGQSAASFSLCSDPPRNQHFVILGLTRHRRDSFIRQWPARACRCTKRRESVRKRQHCYCDKCGQRANSRKLQDSQFSVGTHRRSTHTSEEASGWALGGGWLLETCIEESSS